MSLQERLLRQVVRRLSVDDRQAGPPHVGLRGSNEVGKRDCVAASSRPRHVVQRRIHASHVTGNLLETRDDEWA